MKKGIHVFLSDIAPISRDSLSKSSSVAIRSADLANGIVNYQAVNKMTG